MRSVESDIKLYPTSKSIDFSVQITVDRKSPKIKTIKKLISLQVQKMTQNRVQILGFKSFPRAKFFPFEENITLIHCKTMKMTSQNKSDREI